MKRILLIAIMLLALTAMPSGTTAHEASIEKEAVEMTVGSGSIELTSNVEGRVTLFVYSITGKMVKSVELENGVTIKVDLSNGLYILKCGKWSRKVMIK